MIAKQRTKPAGLDADQYLRLFVEEVRDYAVLTLDPDGIVTTWNAGAEKIKGYRANEIVGRHYSIFYTPEDIKAGKPQRGLRQAVTKGRFEDTGQRVRKDGSRFIADIVITPIFNRRKRLVGFGKITRDVSERQAADDRLRTLVDTVLDTLVDGLIIINSKGSIKVYNKACERLFGYTSAEVRGKNVKMLTSPDVRIEHDRYLRNYQKTGVRKIIGISREVTGQRRDGSVFPMHLAVGEASNLGEPIYVGIIRDLTERNRTEEQLRQSQKMEAMGQLTGGVAHDFNNILMVIMANIDTLIEGKNVDPQVRKRLDQIGKVTQRAADLTSQLLAFSRKQPLRPRPTNLNDLVAATGKLLRRTLGADIEIESILPGDLRTASVDPAQLESALVNLCLNARDAMPDGGKLLIETRNVDLDEDYVALNPDAIVGPYVMMAVSDTGAGMPPEVLKKVFEPFFTTKGAGKGTGLGLSMVYGFTKQSNGHIKIYSELGKGTSIKLYLPRSDGGHEASGPAPTAEMPRGTESILVVEDDAQVRAGVVEQLQSLGYVVAEAGDGAAGLAAFRAADRSFDLLLTDVVMPGPFGGKALADEVALHWPNVPVVFMSGYTENAIVHHGRLDPGVRLLAKPFRKRDLAQMVRDALDGTAD